MMRKKGEYVWIVSVARCLFWERGGKVSKKRNDGGYDSRESERTNGGGGGGSRGKEGAGSNVCVCKTTRKQTNKQKTKNRHAYV